ncbi:molybdopterin-dependent oxidoreductase [Nakamurella sp. YIM 132087]|uniref:Molybdopterin-dependent oxidoreductase n=1 Tax=Nakamurella alba TaxID=2665158 RepID=A0A7K1FRR1_9ACTN|nr:molybdopterin-dependent oxidoreductase [Nakamurella alba]MTD16049.1 molybdopterin-dependent oxidoreductase [Nakamurella alba]
MTATDTPPTDTAGDPDRRPVWAPGFWASAGAGLVIVGAALAVAELVAALGLWIGILNQAASPLQALGAAFIQLTPEWLKEFAIRTFGQHDKDALRGGMALTLVLLAVVVGLVARKAPRVAAIVLTVLIAVVLLAVYTRPSTVGPLDGVPSIIGGAAGVAVLGLLFRRTSVTTAPAAPPLAAPVEMPERRSKADDADTVPAPTGFAPDRRRFFKVAGLVAVAAVAGGAIARFLPSAADVAASRAGLKAPVPTDVQQIPSGISLDVPDQPSFITDNAGFYRVDTAFVLPSLTAQDWNLKIHGLVGNEISMNYDDLLDREQIERTITLTCVSNEVGGDLVGTATWIGARIDQILAEAKVQEGADCVLCTSVDGFTLTAPLDALTDGRDAMFAVAMNGEVLPQAHGFPVRMVVPGLYGYVSATKWLVDMKVSKFADEVAYWTERGWDAQAEIKTSSRIDVPKGFAQYSVGQEVTFAGVAWAQQRGIASVEVQIDGGDWQQAELSEPLSKDTWRQWKFGWKATDGLHTVRCRTTDGTGAVQIEDQTPPFPGGSTGYDSRSVTVS